MDFEQFKKLVSLTKEKHPVWFGLEGDRSPDEKEILSAEQKLGVEFPQEYKNFICTYGGGYFSFSNVFSLEMGSDWNIHSINNEYSEARANYLLVSENGAGDFYGFEVIKGKCVSALSFYDHETQKWSLTQYKNLFEFLRENALSS